MSCHKNLLVKRVCQFARRFIHLLLHAFVGTKSIEFFEKQTHTLFLRDNRVPEVVDDHGHLQLARPQLVLECRNLLVLLVDGCLEFFDLFQQVI